MTGCYALSISAGSIADDSATNNASRCDNTKHLILEVTCFKRDTIAIARHYQKQATSPEQYKKHLYINSI
jgi:hypothetical protein